MSWKSCGLIFFQRLIYKMCIFESKTVQSIIVVSEWLAGGSLFQKLIDSETYSEATVMFYFNQVAEFRFNASPSIELNISGLVSSWISPQQRNCPSWYSSKSLFIGCLSSKTKTWFFRKCARDPRRYPRTIRSLFTRVCIPRNRPMFTSFIPIRHFLSWNTFIFMFNWPFSIFSSQWQGNIEKSPKNINSYDLWRNSLPTRACDDEYALQEAEI